MEPLKISDGNSTVLLNKFEFNKNEGRLSITGESGDYSLAVNVQCPFSIKKVPDSVFDIKKDNGTVLILRNRFLPEQSIIKVKHKSGSSKVVGFVFTLRACLNEESLVNGRKDLTPYAVGALVQLLHNHTSLEGQNPGIRSDSEYNIFDFYEEDLAICVISKDMLAAFDMSLETALLFKLNLYGFYFLNKRNRSFLPPQNSFHKDNLEYLLGENGEGVLAFTNLDTPIEQEPYLNKYIHSLVNKNQNSINRFFISYQCFELLMDYVTKREIQDRVCLPVNTELKGHKLKEIVHEISTESYRLNKLFKHFCSFEFRSHDQVAYEIYTFLSRLKNEYEDMNKTEAGHFYEFRNQLVHNLRLFYDGTEDIVDDNEKSIQSIVDNVELLTAEVVCSVKF